MDIAYKDYTTDVVGFLKAHYPEISKLLDSNSNYHLSQWPKVVAGWKKGTPAAQLATEWLGEFVRSGPVARHDPIFAKRATRKHHWEGAYL